jgi:uncharacterized SAM-binding protein YcdF (DUF218 family)
LGLNADSANPALKMDSRAMMFILSKLLWYIATPGNFFLMIAALGTLRLAFTRRRRGLRLVLIGIGGLAAVTVLPISSWAIAPLENRFPQPVLPEQIDGIVVLGGSVNPTIAEARHQISVPEASERLFEAASLARRYPTARIIVSGGEASIVPRGFSEANVMRDVLVGQGIDSDRIELESKSRNTYENAVNTRQLAQPKPDEKWLLITSGWHMPRAVGCFRNVGWAVLPYPVDYRTTGQSGPWANFVMVKEFLRLDLAAKEWIGLVVYRLLGRTDQLFPAP